MESNSFSILTTIVSVLIGGIITWLFAWLYYVKAGKELIEETKELRKLLNCMIIIQKDDKGIYMPTIDDNGKLATIIANMSSNLSGSSELNSDARNK